MLAFLQAVWLPKKVAMTHCKGHQTDDSPEAGREPFIDQAAREVTQRPEGPLVLLGRTLSDSPVCE